MLIPNDIQNALATHGLSLSFDGEFFDLWNETTDEHVSTHFTLEAALRKAEKLTQQPLLSQV
ncbi:hypothetical protein ACQ4M4_25840 [Leptolyngbya sp. AN02str]|uniref:hypothetical protein n=1 Tax=Leptolyngbya sp. AN02str TaxID=3423363 RepID=UPI003D311C8B